MLKTRTYILLTAIAVAAMLVLSAAWGWYVGREGTHTQAAYKYYLYEGKTKPVKWNLCERISWSAENFNEKEKQVIAAAFKEYEKTLNIAVEQTANNGVIKIRKTKLKPGVLGEALLTTEGMVNKKYTSGTIRLNETLISETKNSRFLTTMLHELGHIFGLGHSESEIEALTYGTVTESKKPGLMATKNYSEFSELPNEEKEALAALYENRCD